MAWRINFATEDDTEKSVNLDDLSPDVFDAIAKDDPDSSWYNVYLFPGATFDRLYRVIKAAAEHLGVDPPDRAQTMRESEALIEMLSQDIDIGKQPMMDGFPQVPDEAETGSSSTSSGSPTAGPPMSSDDSPSETS